jgi:hypothetical protein
MRTTIALCLLSLLLGVAAPQLGAAGDPRNPFDDAILPDPAFRFQGNLTCQVVRATAHTFTGAHFTLRGADTKRVERFWSRDTTGQRIPRIYEDRERIVFQLAGEDPGSVDTLSIDKLNGTFARTWSGWTLESKELGAGGERGRCTVAGGAADAAR